ncbi:DUF4262 domain-containing protein [Micromonospora sp. NPDC005220]|uniref:DUF4262 domain-containing protein n=1 Tax=Micromonospora sp. NPDC005220 TaxID=3155589 RepID=UPI0033BF5266
MVRALVRRRHRHYQRPPFPVVQLLWPDTSGRYPGAQSASTVPMTRSRRYGCRWTSTRAVCGRRRPQHRTGARTCRDPARARPPRR